MKKITLLFLLSIFCLGINSSSIAQSKKPKTQKIGTIYKKDGTVMSGKIRRFYGNVSFEKVDPLYFIKRLFDKDMPNYFADGPQSIKKIKIKPQGNKKFEEVPLEDINGIMFARNFKTSGGDKTYFKVFIGPNHYGKKKKKDLKLALPTLTEGKAINTYGTIYPLRTLWIMYPFLFEIGTPDAYGQILIENTNKDLALSLGFIKNEKRYSKNKALRREKNKNNKNHNTLDELFGDCPETQALIDKYYIKRIENNAERKQAAINYNKTYKKNIKNFRKLIRKNRYKATAELYLQLYEFDLAEIIKTYEKHCLPIDEFDPRHENYKKEFDVINRIKNDSL